MRVGPRLFALRPSDRHIVDLLKDKTAQACSLPTGRILYFTLPMAVEALTWLEARELRQLYRHLEGNQNLYHRIGGGAMYEYCDRLMAHILDEIELYWDAPAPSPIRMPKISEAAIEDARNGDEDQLKRMKWILEGLKYSPPASLEDYPKPPVNVIWRPGMDIIFDETMNDPLYDQYWEALDSLPDSLLRDYAKGRIEVISYLSGHIIVPPSEVSKIYQHIKHDGDVPCLTRNSQLPKSKQREGEHNARMKNTEDTKQQIKDPKKQEMSHVEAQRRPGPKNTQVNASKLPPSMSSRGNSAIPTEFIEFLNGLTNEEWSRVASLKACIVKLPDRSYEMRIPTDKERRLVEDALDETIGSHRVSAAEVIHTASSLYTMAKVRINLDEAAKRRKAALEPKPTPLRLKSTQTDRPRSKSKHNSPAETKVMSPVELPAAQIRPVTKEERESLTAFIKTLADSELNLLDEGILGIERIDSEPGWHLVPKTALTSGTRLYVPTSVDAGRPQEVGQPENKEPKTKQPKEHVGIGSKPTQGRTTNIPQPLRSRRPEYTPQPEHQERKDHSKKAEKQPIRSGSPTISEYLHMDFATPHERPAARRGYKRPSSMEALSPSPLEDDWTHVRRHSASSLASPSIEDVDGSDFMY